MIIVSVIDDYLKNLDFPFREELMRIRSIAKSIMPEGEDIIAYGMPTIRYMGKNIIGFDAYAKHIGIYPYSGHVISTIDALKSYDTSKGAIREKLDQLLPDKLIEEIIRERIKQANV